MPDDPTPEPEPTATQHGEPVAIPPEAERGGVEHVVLTSQLDAALALLRRPPTPEAVKFKIQTNPRTPEKNALIVAYIDARFASDRLNIVCPGLWSNTYHDPPHLARGGKATAAVLARVRLALPDGGEKIVSDVGTTASVETDMGTKALYSDAFKRACVHLGIGAVLYAAPKIFIKGNELRSYEKGGGGVAYELTDANLKYCRGRYGAFLRDVEDIYGAPLSHGDVENAQGDLELEAGEERPADGPPFGPAADEKLTSKLGGALMFLLDDLEAAAAVDAKLRERCGGYMPAVVAACLGITAGAVKTAQEEEAARAAHAELDDAAEAAAASEPTEPEPEPEAPAEPSEAPAEETPETKET